MLHRGSVKIEHTLAQNGSRKLWELMHSEPYVHSLGALTGMQAMQMVKGGLKAIYCSGWQVAADANAAAQVSSYCVATACCHIELCCAASTASGMLFTCCYMYAVSHMLQSILTFPSQQQRPAGFN